LYPGTKNISTKNLTPALSNRNIKEKLTSSSPIVKGDEREKKNNTPF